jgi:hypothetical protein
LLTDFHRALSKSSSLIIFHSLMSLFIAPSIPNYSSLYFCPKSKFSNCDRVYKKKHQHLQHQTSFIELNLLWNISWYCTYLVMLLFFSINLVKVRQVWLRTKLKRTIIWNGGSTSSMSKFGLPCLFLHYQHALGQLCALVPMEKNCM